MTPAVLANSHGKQLLDLLLEAGGRGRLRATSSSPAGRSTARRISHQGGLCTPRKEPSVAPEGGAAAHLCIARLASVRCASIQTLGSHEPRKT